jgi:hypothetical protein
MLGYLPFFSPIRSNCRRRAQDTQQLFSTPEETRFNRLALFNLLSEDPPRFSRRLEFFAIPAVACGL